MIFDKFYMYNYYLEPNESNKVGKLKNIRTG